MKRAAFVSLVLLLAACDPKTSAPPKQKKTPSSAELFGDAALVPSREGERARRDLADAGDLEANLRASGDFNRVRVLVRRPKEGPARASIVGEARGGIEVSTVEAHARTQAQVVLGAEAQVEVSLGQGSVPSPERPVTDPLLWLALLGLGASVGVSVERWRRNKR